MYVCLPPIGRSIAMDIAMSARRGTIGPMPLTDDELLEFDASNYATYDEDKAREILQGEHGDTFRAQLVAARFIDGWRERTVQHDKTSVQTTFSPDYTEGWEKALLEVAAHLRQGDFIPGGTLYNDVTGSWPRPS